MASACAPAPVSTPSEPREIVPLFSCYEIRDGRRLKSYVGSSVIHVIAVLLLLLISLTAPKVVFHVPLRSIQLVAPLETQTVIKLKPATPALAAPRIATPALPIEVLPLSQAVRVPAPVVPPVTAKPAPVEHTAFEPARTAPSAAAPKVIATNVFGSSAPSRPNSSRPVNQVQTVGFGDPNGVAVSKRPTQAAAVGTFTLPASGKFVAPHGTVATAGFVTNAAAPSSAPHGTVASTGFATDAVPSDAPSNPPRGRVEQAQQFNLATVEKKAPPVAQPETTYTPVKVISKPIPVYTDAARRAKVEGEVLVQVLFRATGEIRVLGVTRGLGHGLDEAAIAAAQKVRFTPAIRDGVKVDSTATLHIVFALS